MLNYIKSTIWNIQMTTSAKRINFFKSIKFKAWLGIFTLTICPLILFGLYAFDSLGNISRDILIEGNIFLHLKKLCFLNHL